jgi:Ca2+/Na+ antiporter
MSQATARLLMAIGAIVGTPLFATLLFIFFESTWIRADQDAFIAACVSTGFLFILGWIAIWRRAVSWTRFRRLMMAVSVFWSVGIATIVGYCAGELAPVKVPSCSCSRRSPCGGRSGSSARR